MTTAFGGSRQTIKVPSIEKGIELDVWFYRPSTPAPYPVVVAGHGLTVIKDAGLAAFGERWSRDAGYAALIFDYRGFGMSGGLPRNFVTVEKQLQDYKSILEWVRDQPDKFREDKIVAMGSAFSGLHVADLVVHDGGIAGGMAHCPMLDGYKTIASSPVNLWFLFWAVIDAVREKIGLTPKFIKAIGKPDEYAFMASDAAYNGFTAMFSQGETPFTQAPNVFPARLLFDIMKARQGAALRHAKCPTLVVMAEADELIPTSVTREVVEQAQGKVKMIVAPGGHFDVMQGGKGYEVNITAQINFLRDILHDQ